MDHHNATLGLSMYLYDIALVHGKLVQEFTVCGGWRAVNGHGILIPVGLTLGTHADKAAAAPNQTSIMRQKGPSAEPRLAHWPQAERPAAQSPCRRAQPTAPAARVSQSPRVGRLAHLRPYAQCRQERRTRLPLQVKATLLGATAPSGIYDGR